jgi:hypothetical protein
MRESKEYLKHIDSKVTEVLRQQKDVELAKLFGTRASIERALDIRDGPNGETDATTWSTVQDKGGVLDDLLSWAFIGLGLLPDKLKGDIPAGERAKVAKGIEPEVAEFLAVIAHCFELQDALGVLRLDRIESPWVSFLGFLLGSGRSQE